MHRPESGASGRDQSVVAIIPARAGSKGVPGKNLRVVGGLPLIARAVAAARAAELIDVVAVSTDGDDIAAAAQEAGAQIIERPAELATDASSSESALLHALDELEATGIRPTVLVFIQATSPFISPRDLDDAVQRILDGESDVVLSVVESHGFLWRLTGHGAVGVNHDSSFRPRRQDREAEYLETGAFYVMRVDGFREAGFRFFGRVGVALTDERHALEIDTLAELDVAEAIARSEAAATEASTSAITSSSKGHS
ncbi:cytidylyltransferase domain-containing protein [Gryllotalpicola reticulitermitis]|uniref:Cytidylyltransferase domain-containing protein n=1 Tax=Gryllotalpicola reticulitermitis TaxID=1184153 RepID=A0ABV8Q3N7_9MICO